MVGLTKEVGFNLNTSHVLIYPASSASVAYSSSHLNTSHVLIYLGVDIKLFDERRFKYISCSYLSTLIKSLNSSFLNLNTSHVLIYPSVAVLIVSSSSDLNTSHVLIYLKVS